MSEEFWEGRYRERPQIWSGDPNPQLVAVTSSLTPGSALDLGCGEGGDAIWLAGRGWQVTAVDVSPTALERGRAAAERAGIGERVVFEQHDLAATLPGGPFDLVSAQFLQSPIEFPRQAVLRGAAAAVAPGGLFLLVDHAAPPPWAQHAHGQPFPTLEETFASLELTPPSWVAEILEVREREATGPGGEAAALRDSVIALRRR